MTKNSKRKLLFMTLFLTVLLVSSAYAALIPNVHAAEMTAQQKGLSILSDVVGLDLTKYTVTAEEAQAGPQASYLDVVPQEKVAYELTSDGSKLKALYTFANGNLQMIHVLEREGSLNLVKPAKNLNDVELAKDFLSNYQTYTANPLFGELKSTLNYVVAGKNLTKTSGNTVFEVTARSDYTHFKWYYTVNGAIAPYSKFISLGFKNGFLKAFVDRWTLHRVGSTSVNLSKEQAVTIALDCARTHSWSMQLDEDTLDASNLNEKKVSWSALTFDGSLNAEKARSEDPLTLYPVWRIGLVLNKWYGPLYGIEVDIWADTREVRSVQEAYSTLPPPEDMSTANLSSQAPAVSESKLNLALLVALPTLAAAVGTAMVWMVRKKKSHGYTLLRRRGLKTGGILLCILISSTVFIGAIATVNATTRAGVIWGSRSSGAPNDPYSFSWRKTDDEISHQWSLATNFEDWFAANGYTGVDHQGINSSKSQILADISYLQSNNDYLVVVDFDHGVGSDAYSGDYGVFHFMFEDDVGCQIGPANDSETASENGVYDMDIYPLVDKGQVALAFINTCYSANLTRPSDGTPWQGLYNNKARGMPFAWTHGRYVVDKSETPGFNVNDHMSDDGYGDPDVGSQVYIGFPYGSASLEQNIPYNYGSQYYLWVWYFFYYALYWDYSVNQVLDLVSDYKWGCGTFGDSPLRGQGFTAVWPMDKDGNGTFENDYGLHSTMAVYGDGNIHLKQYVPDYVSPPSVSGPTSGYIDTSYQFTASSTDAHGHNIRYTFDWGDGTSQTVTDYYPSGATANASHSWSSEYIFSVTVRAQCDNGAWSSWSSPHNIEIGDMPTLTVLAYNQYGQPGYPPVYIDDEYVGPAGYSYNVTPGNHQIYVYSPIYEYWEGHYYAHTFQYYYYDSTYNYNNPMTLSITADKTVTAYYYTYMLM
jgi:hypothetical protein